MTYDKKVLNNMSKEKLIELILEKDKKSSEVKCNHSSPPAITTDKFMQYYYGV